MAAPVTGTLTAQGQRSSAFVPKQDSGKDPTRVAITIYGSFVGSIEVDVKAPDGTYVPVSAVYTAPTTFNLLVADEGAELSFSAPAWASGAIGYKAHWE